MNPAPINREALIRERERFFGPEVTARLLAVIRTDGSDTTAARNALLEVAAGHPVPRARIAALAVLTLAGVGLPPQFESRLEGLAGDPDAGVRAGFQAMVARHLELAPLPTVLAWVPAISRQLADADAGVRFAAFRLVHARGKALARAVCPEVIAGVGATDRRVRLLALDVLRTLGDEAAAGVGDVARTAATATEPDVLDAAVAALIALDPRHTTAAAHLTPHLTAHQRYLILDALDRIEGGPGLRAALLRPDDQADGPVSPDRVRWAGKEIKVEANVYRLLAYLWARRDKAVPVDDADEAMSGGGNFAPQRVKSALVKARKVLKQLGVPFTFRAVSGYIRCVPVEAGRPDEDTIPDEL